MAVAAKGREALTDKGFLAKVKENDGKSKRELAKDCGYYTVSKDGQTRGAFSDFYDALLAAKGIQLEPQKNAEGRSREASYTLTVHPSGQGIFTPLQQGI